MPLFSYNYQFSKKTLQHKLSGMTKFYSVILSMVVLLYGNATERDCSLRTKLSLSYDLIQVIHLIHEFIT